MEVREEVGGGDSGDGELVGRAWRTGAKEEEGGDIEVKSRMSSFVRERKKKGILRAFI